MIYSDCFGIESDEGALGGPSKNSNQEKQSIAQRLGANPLRSSIPQTNDKANSTLAFNLSMQQSAEMSFDMKGDLETLSKNIGNISTINNSKLVDTHNVSQLEMDDIILRSMLENPEKAKISKENGYFNLSAANVSYKQPQNHQLLPPQPKVEKRSKSRIIESQKPSTQMEDPAYFLQKKREPEPQANQDRELRERSLNILANTKAINRSPPPEQTATHGNNDLSTENSKQRLSYQLTRPKENHNISVNKENRADVSDIFDVNYRYSKSQQKTAPDLDMSTDFSSHHPHNHSTNSKPSSYQQTRNNSQYLTVNQVSTSQNFQQLAPSQGSSSNQPVLSIKQEKQFEYEIIFLLIRY